MPSIRRTLLPAHQENYDRPLPVPLIVEMKEKDQMGYSSPRSSSSPPLRRSLAIFSFVAGLRRIGLLALKIFVPKPFTRKRWRPPLTWNDCKRSLLRFFFFFLLGFLLGITPFFDIDLGIFRPTGHHPVFFRSEISAARRELGTIFNPPSAQSGLKEIAAIQATGSKLLIIVTPTYNRALQSYYLHRLGQTLRLVPPPLLWLVVEMESASDETADVLLKMGVMYRHLVCKKNSKEVKDRGVHQRNTALEHIESHHLDGIVYQRRQAMAAAPALRELQRVIETQANALSKIQKDIAKNHQVRKQYTIQLGENELVLKELDILNEGANVYKLIGPVLVKQDLAEAKANVRKRIEYISAELKRLDGTLKDLEGKQSSKQEAVLKVQQKIQALQAGKSKS